MNHLRLTDRDPLERRVATWMAGEEPASSAASDPEIDRILFATSRVRPDPRWLALLKESPMRTTTDAGPRIAVGTPARAFVLALLLISLLVAAGLAVVASGVLEPVVIPPAPLSALTWRQTVPNGSFAPMANLARDPQGRIWVVDGANSKFAIYQPDGTFVTFWQPSDGPAIDLVRDTGDTYGAIAFAPDGSRYILDVGNHRVLAYDPSGAFRTTWGSEGVATGQLSDPTGILVRDDGSVSVFDDNRGVIETYDRDGAVLGTVSVITTVPAGFNTANGFAIDAAGNLYVSQITTSRSGQVQKFSPTGQPLTVFGASGPGQFQEQPGLIAIDGAGRLYVTQGFNRIDGLGVLVFNPDGTYVGGFGPAGNATEDALGFPTGILIDREGNLIVVDSGAPVQGQFVDPSIESYKIGLSTSP
jgi:hypothetical protein